MNLEGLKRYEVSEIVSLAELVERSFLIHFLFSFCTICYFSMIASDILVFQEHELSETLDAEIHEVTNGETISRRVADPYEAYSRDIYSYLAETRQRKHSSGSTDILLPTLILNNFMAILINCFPIILLFDGAYRLRKALGSSSFFSCLHCFLFLLPIINIFIYLCLNHKIKKICIKYEYHDRDVFFNKTTLCKTINTIVKVLVFGRILFIGMWQEGIKGILGSLLFTIVLLFGIIRNILDIQKALNIKQIENIYQTIVDLIP